jgi:predicted amidohydrolase
MKSKINVSLVQFEPEFLHRDANASRMCAFARDEARQGAQLIVFPELSNTGYVEPLAAGEPVYEGTLTHAQYASRLHEAASTPDGPLIDSLSTIAKEYRTHIVAGLALREPVHGGLLHNASVLIGPTGLIGIYRKIHLWHSEKLYFAPGRRLDVFDTDAGRIGMQICYDIRFPEVTRILGLKGAQIVTSVWAAPWPLGVPLDDDDAFRHRAYTRAMENGVFFLSCNRVGAQGAHRFLGRSVIAAPGGHLLASSSSESECVVRAELDPACIADYRSMAPVWVDRRPDVYEEAMAGLPSR